jgi:hypothetical protein
MAVFDTMWSTYGDFRTSMYVISHLWTALLLIQAAGTALIISQATYSTAYNYDQILPWVAIALGVVGIARHRPPLHQERQGTRGGRQRGSTRLTGPPTAKVPGRLLEVGHRMERPSSPAAGQTDGGPEAGVQVPSDRSRVTSPLMVRARRSTRGPASVDGPSSSRSISERR